MFLCKYLNLIEINSWHACCNREGIVRKNATEASMHQSRSLVLLGALLFPVLGFSTPLSHQEAIALYAADASASLVLPVSLVPQSAADALLSRQVTDAVSGIVASGAAEVDVHVAEGYVVLRGQVANAGVLDQVLEMVRTVQGVKEVTSELVMVAG
jgi:zona occludens toxin (predicted ATPase)